MHQFVWNNLVRITVGEMSRADHFDYSAAIRGYFDVSNDAFLMAADDLLVSHSPTLIEVCVDGQWTAVEGEISLREGIDTLILKRKMSLNDVRQLPISLFNQWSMAATDANPYIRNLFLPASNSPTSTPSSSALPSDSAPSSGPASKKPSRTKTGGDKTPTHKNSSAG